MFVCMKLLAPLSAFGRSVCNLELLVSCNKHNKFRMCVANDIVTVSRIAQFCLFSALLPITNTNKEIRRINRIR